jgi:hypothetical protein
MSFCSKYPNDPDATQAFQKLSVAYDILSKPSSRRAYELRSTKAPYDVFSARPRTAADETFRAVILGVFNDFLDGDLEVIRSMLRTCLQIPFSFLFFFWHVILVCASCSFSNTVIRFHRRFQSVSQVW